VLGRLPFTGDEAYDGVKGIILKLAGAQTAVLQNGSLRRYLFVIFATTAVAGGGTLIFKGGVAWPAGWPDVPIYEWGIVALIAAGAVLPMTARSRLAAICGLGTVGSGVALIFLIYGAPDVAMTQLLVEVLFVVMISVVLLKLPRFSVKGHPPKRGRIGDLALAAASGGVVTLMTLAVLDTPMNDHLTRYFEANSMPGGHGGNIVNVILVDFRALDTLGEIIVVAVAALGAFALIKMRPQPANEGAPESAPRGAGGS
jgi:multicomponent Na+:H+ antiporter subunit A